MEKSLTFWTILNRFLTIKKNRSLMSRSRSYRHDAYFITHFFKDKQNKNFLFHFTCSSKLKKLTTTTMWIVFDGRKTNSRFFYLLYCFLLIECGAAAPVVFQSSKNRRNSATNASALEKIYCSSHARRFVRQNLNGFSTRRGGMTKSWVSKDLRFRGSTHLKGQFWKTKLLKGQDIISSF